LGGGRISLETRIWGHKGGRMKTCLDCGVPLKRSTSKRCYSCAAKARWTDPGIRERIMSRHAESLTDDVRRKMSESAKVRWMDPVLREEFGTWSKEKWGDPDYKAGRSGENHPLWRDGAAESKYPPEFTSSFRNSVRERDGWHCAFCGDPQADDRLLSVHHVDYDKFNNEMNNLVSLCVCCYASTNHDRDNWQEGLEALLEKRGAKNNETISINSYCLEA